MRRQSGISLVELMIAMVIGLIIVGAAVGAFLSSRQSYAVQSQLIRLQDNARFAIEVMQEELRQSGFLGCNGAITPGNAVINSAALAPLLRQNWAIDGGDNQPSTASHGLTPVAGQDWVLSSYASSAQQCVVATHNVNASQIQCAASNPFEQGQLLLISDCKQSTVFQQSNAILASATSATDKVLEHKNDTAAKPGNCTSGLGNPVTCTVQGNRYQYRAGSMVYAIQQSRFLLANNSYGVPSLYQQSIQPVAGELKVINTELVEGVERMQLLYGLDVNGDGNQLAYRSIDQIEPEKRSSIVGVRISLLLRADQANVGEDQTVDFAGETLSFTDGRLRRVYTSHIALRNQL